MSVNLHKTSSKDADSDFENELLDDLEANQADPDSKGDSPSN
jgi:hypothetical protein